VSTISPTHPSTRHLLLLNSQPPACAKEIWTHARNNDRYKRICADGAADRLYNMFCDKAISFASWAKGFEYHPTLVIGDLDSITPAVRAFYEKNPRCEVHQIDDQNSTDFTKALRYLRDFENQSATPVPVVVLGGVSGRLDQTLSTLYALTDMSLSNLDITVVDEGNIVMMLAPGRHRIQTGYRPDLRSSDSDLMFGPHCGLFPFSSRPVRTISNGLEWCMDGSQSMSLDASGLISTNNRIIDTDGIVEVDCDGSVLFSLEYTYQA
jgi:thiamine pyrophosphokinase